MLKICLFIGLGLFFGSFVWIMLAGLWCKLSGKRVRSDWPIVTFILMFWGGFLWLGVVLTVVGSNELWKSWNVKSWTAVEASVVQSSVDAIRKKDRTRYRPAVTYQYHVDGRAYQSDRIGFIVAECSRKEAEAIVAQKYTQGTVLAAYVNPRDPAEATLDNSFAAKDLVIVAIGLLSIGVSAYGFRRSMLHGPLF